MHCWKALCLKISSHTSQMKRLLIHLMKPSNQLFQEDLHGKSLKFIQDHLKLLSNLGIGDSLKVHLRGMPLLGRWSNSLAWELLRYVFLIVFILWSEFKCLTWIKSLTILDHFKFLSGTNVNLYHELKISILFLVQAKVMAPWAFSY